MPGALSYERALRLRAVAWIGAAAMLALPALAMRFTPEVNWTAFDFAVFGGMLGLVVVPFHLALPRARNLCALAGICAALVTGFVEIWANLAVGIVGDGLNVANVAFLCVPLVAVLGTAVASGRTPGMARAMMATAVLQALLLIALAALMPQRGVYLTAAFVAGWLVSGALLRRSLRMPDWHRPAS